MRREVAVCRANTHGILCLAAEEEAEDRMATPTYGTVTPGMVGNRNQPPASPQGFRKSPKMVSAAC